MRRPVQPVVQADVLLGAVLADSVRRLGQRQHVLQRRYRRVPSVQRAAGRAEQHPRVGRPGRFQHVDRADARSSAASAAGRVDRGPHVDLRGQVADQLGPDRVDDLRRAAARRSR